MLATGDVPQRLTEDVEYWVAGAVPIGGEWRGGGRPGDRRDPWGSWLVMSPDDVTFVDRHREELPKFVSG